MYRVDAIYFNPHYKESLEQFNLDLVGYVIRKSDNKVVDVAVTKRESLASWYEARGLRFGKEDHDFVIASISIIGEIKGMETKEVEDGSGKKKDRYSPTKIHVN